MTLKELFHSKSKTVAAAAVLLGGASLVSRLVGIWRDRLLSGTFGAGPELDAYYAAFRIPDLVYSLIVMGTISAGFIPVFAAVASQERDRDGLNAEANRLVSLLLTVLGVGLAAAAAVGIVFAPRFVPLITPGFSEETLALTIKLTRLMFLSPVIMGLSSVFGGLLQARRRFIAYSLAPILYNLGIIAGVVLFGRSWGIIGAAYGVLIGTVLHLAIQAVAGARCGWRPQILWQPADPQLREMARLAGPRMAGLALNQVGLTVITVLASLAGAGGVAVFSLANNLQSFPVGVVGVSFAVAAFPLIAELAARGEKDKAVAEFSRAVRSVLFLVLPATVALLLLRAQVVRVVLGSGKFDWNDTIATADALSYLALSLFAQSLLPLVQRTYLAFRDAATPFRVGAVALALQTGLAWWLVRRGFGPAGLGLAFSVGQVVNLAVLWVILRRRLGSLNESVIVKPLIVMCLSGLVMAVTVQTAKTVLGEAVNMRTFLGIFTQGAVAGTLGLGAYLLVAWRLGSEDARRLVAIYVRRRPVAPAAGAVSAPEQSDNGIVT